jgi:hypothetical protein
VFWERVRIDAWAGDDDHPKCWNSTFRLRKPDHSAAGVPPTRADGI